MSNHETLQAMDTIFKKTGETEGMSKGFCSTVDCKETILTTYYYFILDLCVVMIICNLNESLHGIHK